MKYIPSHKLKEFREANTPKKCPILKVKLSDAVVDHCHKTGMIRGILHRQANAWEGKVFNSWRRYAQNNSLCSYIETLENLVQYLKRGCTDYLHPVGLVQLGKRFAKLKKEEQVLALKQFNFKKDEINACVNTEDRVKLYKQFLKNL